MVRRREPPGWRARDPPLRHAALTRVDAARAADDLKLLSTAESLLNVEANLIFVSGVVLLLAEAGLIAVVPDDNAALIAIQASHSPASVRAHSADGARLNAAFACVQALTGLAAGAGAVTAFGAAFLFSLLQGEK